VFEGWVGFLKIEFFLFMHGVFLIFCLDCAWELIWIVFRHEFSCALKIFSYAYFSMHTMCLIKCLSDDLHVLYMIFSS
jgi:hypothetical protein